MKKNSCESRNLNIFGYLTNDILSENETEKQHKNKLMYAMHVTCALYAHLV